MKILLLQSYLENNAFLIFPSGLAAIGATLNDHEVRALDLNLVKHPGEELRKIRAQFNPEIIGISFRNIDDQNRRDLRYYYRTCFQPDIRRIRSVFGDSIKLVAGGSGFSIFAEQIMEENPEIDFGVFLEAEESFPLLLRNLSAPERVKGIFYRKGNTVIFTGKARLPDFKTLPMPKWDLFNPRDYIQMPGIGVQTVRGCTNQCSYCVYPRLNGKHFRYKNPTSVADEIKLLKTRFGIDKFFFIDASFGLAKRHSVEVLEEMIKQKLDVQWGAYFDLNADPEFLIKAYEAGCREYIFSPDGFSENALKHLKKNFTLSHLKEHIRFMQTNQTLKNCFKFYTFMIASPGETPADYIRSFISLMIIRIKSALKITHPVSVSVSWIRIEPDTKICQMAMKQQDISQPSDLLPEISDNYERLFYINPPSKTLDAFFCIIMKTFSRLKALISK